MVSNIQKLLLLLLIFSCGKNAYSQKSGATKYPDISVAKNYSSILGLKFTEIHVVLINKFNDSITTEISLFDRVGHEVRRTLYEGGEVNHRVFVFKWTNGLLTQTAELNSLKDNDTLSQTLYKYDFPTIARIHFPNGHKESERTLFTFNADSTVAEIKQFGCEQPEKKVCSQTKYEYMSNAIYETFYVGSKQTGRQTTISLDKNNILEYETDSTNVYTHLVKTTLRNGKPILRVFERGGDVNFSKYFYNSKGLVEEEIVTDDNQEAKTIYQYV